MKILTDMLHLLLCQHPHESDMMKIVDRTDAKCYYYLENDIAGGEEMQNHLEWINIVNNFKTSLSLASDEEALNFVKECIKISQRSRELVGSDDGRKNFLMSLLS